MEKKAKIVAILIVALLGAAGLAWVWWPEPTVNVDPALVETAARSAQEAASTQPPMPEEIKYEGRAKPGPLGGTP